MSAITLPLLTRPAVRHLTDEQKLDIVLRANAGERVKDIAALHQISVAAVYRFLKRVRQEQERG